jgi:uncharacterized coiled-coil DUF342 family protein
MDTEKEINDLKTEDKRLRGVIEKLQIDFSDNIIGVGKQIDEVKKQIDEIKKQIDEIRKRK